ncbi:MAG TPA: tetratricopeptide repeat protein [Tepidisphaeraceae bacterium]|nr:tetratricopeptide repeat protein [Tepidisphaeraceae bacterium]
MNQTRNRYLPAICSALLGLALFAVTIGGTYIFDDRPVVLNDPRIHDPHLWVKLWTRPYNNNADKLYRPLTSMTYAIQWSLHGDRAWAFHLVNLILHVAVCGLFAEFVRRLMGMKAAMVAGLLFAAHPIHVEAAANIVGRAELMCALGIFGAFTLCLKPITLGRAMAIFGCMWLAVLTKEQGMLLPAMLLLLWPVRARLHLPPDNRQGKLLLILLSTWGLAIYIVARERLLGFTWDRSFLDWTMNPLMRSQGIDRWLMPLVLLGHYTALLVAPLKLSMDYGAMVIGWTARAGDPYLWLGILAAAVWCAIAIAAICRRRWTCLFAAISLAISYGLVSNMIALIGVNMAERLMYTPSAFFLILVAMAMVPLPRTVLIPAMVIAVGLLGVRSLSYAWRWNNANQFYAISLREQPRSIMLYRLLAADYAYAGQYEQAEQVMDQAAALLDDYFEVQVERGWIRLEQNKFDQAEQDFTRAMELNPSSYVEGWFNELGRRRSAAATNPSAPPTFKYQVR